VQKISAKCQSCALESGEALGNRAGHKTRIDTGGRST
jgi:hypothetical protein